ncbi:hypothetical protein [Prosthecobacter sp.]|uniref:hypothetical protein n=1 Tax=Prosthecobacter sp. TaxID=1965333 RepID=UPI003783DC60
MSSAPTPAPPSAVTRPVRSRRRLLLGAGLLIGILVAGGVWYARERQPRPLVITLHLQHSSPLSRQHFEMLELNLSKDTGAGDWKFKTPEPTLSQPDLKVWTLDPAECAGFSLDLRDKLGIPQPWKREILCTDFDTLARHSRRVDLTVGGNALRVTFRIADHKLSEADYWRYTLIGGDVLLLRPATSKDTAIGTGTNPTVDASGKPWRLVERSPILRKTDPDCSFALISPGHYRVDLLNSAGQVMLTGPLHLPADSDAIQPLEVLVARP